MAIASTHWLINWSSIPRTGTADDSLFWNIITSPNHSLYFDDSILTILGDTENPTAQSSGDGYLDFLGGSGISNVNDIPDDANLTGLIVEIKRVTTATDPLGRYVPSYTNSSTAGISITDSIVQLVFNGEFIGDDKSNADFWSQVNYETKVFGGETDTWGLSGSAFTSYLVKNSGFGLSIAPHATWGGLSPGALIVAGSPPYIWGPQGGLASNARIEQVKLTFFYDEPIDRTIYPSSILDQQIGTQKLIRHIHPFLNSVDTNPNHILKPSNQIKSSEITDLSFVNHSLLATNKIVPLSINSQELLTKHTISKDDTPLGIEIFSDYLIAKKLIVQNFVPNDAQINGITVTIRKKGQANNGTDWYGFDNEVKLIVNNSIVGNNKAKTSDKWPLNYEDTIYGGENDTWGLSLTGLDVNSNNFGVAVNLKFIQNIDPASIDFEVDSIDIKICYAPEPVPQTIAPKGIASEEKILRHKLISDNYDITWLNQIYTPSYEMGYVDVMALSQQINIDPNFDLSFNALNTNYLFSANNINLNYKQNSNFDKRLAGEGANSNVFKVDAREFTLDFTLPVRIETWGYADTVFSALYDYFIQGYKGSPTTFIGRILPNNDIAIGSTNKFLVNNISDFAGIGTSFPAYIKSEDNSENGESIIVESVSKSTKTLNLKNYTIYSHTPSKSYIWAVPTNPASNREPSFSIFSLKEGLMSGCLVDKISLRIVPESNVEASVTVKFTNLDREYQKNILENFSSLVEDINNRRPNYLLNGTQVSIQSTRDNSGTFGLGSAKDSKLFRGFQEQLIRDFEINEVTLDFSNNLQPIYTLNSKKNNKIENFNKNLQPYAYFSNGRSITGSIKYSSPIKPWLFAEKLSGSSSINKNGLIIDFGPFKLTLPEIAWTPENSTSSVTEVQQKNVSFSVISNKIFFDPYLEPTGEL